MAIEYVYADCAASAPVLPRARLAMEKAVGANPNSVHRMGRDARGLLEESRAVIARCINASPEEIAFTPSATAACHYAIKRLGICNCSFYEHKAVFDTIPSNPCDPDSFAHMLANNETGELFDQKVKSLAQSRPVFTDATAAVGNFPVDVQDLGVDALAAGGHKFGAYPGIGFVYVRGGVSDEDTFPGTPPVGLAVAMASALEYRTGHIIESTEYLLNRRSALIDAIMSIPGAHINCVGKLRLPNILSVRFDGVNARELLTMLDALGVYASAGSACTADSDEPSRALLASGLTEEQALSTIRLSFCPETTPEAFSFVSDALSRAVPQLRALSR